MEMVTFRTKVSRSHSEIGAFLSLTFCSPNPTYDIYLCRLPTAFVAHTQKVCVEGGSDVGVDLYPQMYTY